MFFGQSFSNYYVFENFLNNKFSILQLLFVFQFLLSPTSCTSFVNQTINSDDVIFKNSLQWDSNAAVDTSLEKPIELSRSKREVFRGQNHHYQRGYELSRLRFENEHPDRPKAFFVREYHEGRDVPKSLLALTQPHSVSDPVSSGLASSLPATTSSSSLIETDVSSGGSSSRGGAESMKTMSDDYRQRLYATKAALKAVLQSGDKDLSILEYIKAKQEKAKAKAKEKATGGGGDRPDDDNDEQTKEDGSRPGSGDGINKGVHFDEQIKENLDKIASYDPSKPYGERLRPWTSGGAGYPTTRRPSYPGSGSGYPSRVPGISGVGGGGGLPGSQVAGAGDYLNKLRRLYPHLFPEFDIDSLTGGGGKPGGSGGSVGDEGGGPGGVRPDGGAGSGVGDASGRPGSSAAAGGHPGAGEGGVGPGVPHIPFVPAGGAGPSGGGAGGGLWPGSRKPSGGLNGSIIIPPGGSGFRNPYPSRFPGTRLSGLTLWPNVRNSSFPGIPGYIRYDYPGYSTVPYTGFRCDLMPYKYGYYADVSAGCQVFHICQKDGRMDSFLCPNGTLFHQKVMTCDWWYHVHCPSSSGFYYLNGRIGVLPFLPATLARFD